jgi:glucosyl-3-phosphoglycerate synthase
MIRSMDLLTAKFRKKIFCWQVLCCFNEQMVRLLPRNGRITRGVGAVRAASSPNAGRKVSVIIPVLNESETVGSVVEFALRSRLVGEVIVVDDGSIDGTPDLAKNAGAKVLTSTMLGKGASMEDGMRAARHEILLYLDGDLRGLQSNVVELMAAPILNGGCDFVKPRFTRRSGRVTALTARPLLRTYFPELADFHQPLSGIICVRRSMLQSLRFENDYGVDIGLFIDAAMAKARLVEVDIGHIEHISHPLEVLEDMATQVARTILDRAAAFGRLRSTYVQEVRENERHRRADLSMALQRLPGADRLALFDMDGVLLNGRFIVELAARTDRSAALSQFLDNHSISAEERTRKIAAIFAGVRREIFEQTAREIPLTNGAIETVVGLRKAGFRVGIITDSFHLAAETVRRRVFADFCCAHLVRFRRGISTQRLTLAPAMRHPRGCPDHAYCKVNVLHHLIEKLEISPRYVAAFGDGENDVCLLRAAGRSIAFEPKSPNVAAAAQHCVYGDLSEGLRFVLDENGSTAPETEDAIQI